MAINKFYTLNKMQRSTTGGFSMGIYLWEVNAEFKGQKRVVTFIRKDKETGLYSVTLSGKTFKTFMAALASTLNFYVSVLRSIIISQCPPDYTGEDYNEILGMTLSNAATWNLGSLERPRLPTYDRGPKKEALHPLRRAVTALFGGKYSR